MSAVPVREPAISRGTSASALTAIKASYSRLYAEPLCRMTSVERRGRSASHRALIARSSSSESGFGSKLAITGSGRGYSAKPAVPRTGLRMIGVLHAVGGCQDLVECRGVTFVSRGLALANLALSGEAASPACPGRRLLDSDCAATLGWRFAQRTLGGPPLACATTVQRGLLRAR